ncbi:MAG: ABC transporter ATP-binding protein [Gammaproteobacteria bacterium]|nr:ABC transporter ATP-binding protein [Gammaproteobacteria bacterium]
MTDSAHHSPLVQLVGITKAFPGCLANDRVGLTIKEGTIHALLGENGAGKSTLVKVLYGLLAADAGGIQWRGKSVNIDSPVTARSLGIAMVFQHFSLFESLSVLENIALGIGRDANDALAEEIIEVSERYGLPLDPTRSVYTLSVGERQRIEIVRCLLQDPRLLIMDEPTSVLTPQEVSDLFQTLKRLRSEGVAILYISHKLEEIRVLCDEATILRNGQCVATANPQEETATSLAALMMGTELEQVERVQKPVADTIRLSVNTPLIQLQVCAGEIVGIAGVAGNGQDELMSLISGETPSADDAVLLDQRSVGAVDAGTRRRLGLCCVPEERLGHAAVPTMTLAENALLTGFHRKSFRQFGWIRWQRARHFAGEIIEQFNVQCNGPNSTAASLSGGNLQKFIVGREVLQQPEVLVVSQPTWGVDAGAAIDIHRALQALAQQGSAVLVVSQDLDELLSLTDRIGALCAGKLSDIYPTANVSVAEVGLLMGGQTRL